MWAAIPSVLCGIRASAAPDATALGERFVAEHDNFFRWYFWGRLFNLVWPLATAVLVYVWALERWGLPSARAALLCICCCPELLAHGTLVTPDAAAMFGFLLTSYLISRWAASPGWHHALAVGVALGALLTIKFTGIVFVPIVFGTLFIIGPLQAKQRVVQGGLILAVMLSVLALMHGFQGLGVPLADFTFQSTDLRTIQLLLQPISRISVPLPRDYLLGIDQQRAIMESAHPVFLDGVWRTAGFMHYYLCGLAYKLPHTLQLLGLLGLVFAMRAPRGERFRGLVALCGPVVLLMIIASLSGMQLGFRYVLPVIPAGALIAVRAMHGLNPLSSTVRRVVQMCVVALLVTNLRHHPHHLAYFNELAGGPIGGRHHLLDSNLDWGQDLGRAADYVRAHPEERARFAYFGTVDPRRVGLVLPLPPSWQPEPGLYLVSVNFVMGRPHVAWQPDGTHRAIDFREFAYFRKFRPIAHLGYSIDVYRITPQDVAPQ